MGRAGSAQDNVVLPVEEVSYMILLANSESGGRAKRRPEKDQRTCIPRIQ
jgi:hypothetical protein